MSMPEQKLHDKITDNSERIGDEDDDQDQLPVVRRRTTALLDAPKQGVKLVIERGADVYYSTCRRIAEFLNRNN